MIHLGSAILMLIFGYLVKVKRWSWLIAGYNTSSKAEKDKYDEEALCKGVGNFLYTLAAVLVLASIGEFFDRWFLVGISWESLLF